MTKGLEASGTVAVTIIVSALIACLVLDHSAAAGLDGLAPWPARVIRSL